MNRELFAAARAETWAIHAPWLQAALERGGSDAARKPKLPGVTGAIAILPMRGMISQHGSIWEDVFGGTSTDRLAAALSRAIGDDRVAAVVIDVDSPGGTTYGIEELSGRIVAAAERKPVVAVANSLMASAAYWLGSQAGQGRVFAAPGSDVGSVGVYRMLEDVSKALEDDGIKIEFIAQPPEKVEDFGHIPLSEEARAHHEEQVGMTYDKFVGAVAKARGVTPSRVKTAYGKGRLMKGEQAVEIGMADRVASLADIIAELSRSGKADISTSASKQIQDELCHAWETCECEPLSRKDEDISTRKRRAYLLDK